MHRPSTHRPRRSRTLPVLAGFLLFLLTACAGGGTDTPPVPQGAAPPEAAGGGNAVEGIPTGLEGGPEYDLEGVEVTVTTSAPGALNVGTFFAFQRLREWGAEVEVVVLTTTTGIQTLIAGRSDIGQHGSDEVVLGAAEGADVVAIGAPSTRMDYVLVGKTEIADVAALEGRTIAMSGPAGFDALLSRLSLEREGLDPSSAVNFVQVGGSPERATALLAGQADAATIFLEDWEELSRRTEDLHLIQYMADIVPEFPASAYFAERSFWEDNAELAGALACANLQANVWINADKERFVDYALQLVEGATEEGVSAVYDAAQEIDMFPTEPEEIFSIDGLQGLVDAMVETGDISEPVDPSQHADLSYLQDAAEQGCGEAQ